MTDCCGEPDCRRRTPIGLYLGDFDGRVYAATRSRPRRERPRGPVIPGKMVATGKHDVTGQMIKFIRDNPGWVMAVLARDDSGRDYGDLT